MNQLGKFEQNVVRAIELIYMDLRKNWADHDKFVTKGSNDNTFQNDPKYIDPGLVWLSKLGDAADQVTPIRVVTMIFNDVYKTAYNQQALRAFRSNDPRAYLPIQFQINGVVENGDGDQNIIKAQSGSFKVYDTDPTIAARDVQYIYETQLIWSEFNTENGVRWFPTDVETPITIKNETRDYYSPNRIFIEGNQVGQLSYAGYLGNDSNNGTMFLKKGMTVSVVDTDPSIFVTFTVPFDCYAQVTLDYEVWQKGKVSHIQLYDLQNLSHQIVITDSIESYSTMREIDNPLITFKEPNSTSGAPY